MNLDTDAWNPTMEKALNVIYKLASHPDEIANELLQEMAAKLLDTEAKQTSTTVGVGGTRIFPHVSPLS